MHELHKYFSEVSMQLVSNGLYFEKLPIIYKFDLHSLVSDSDKKEISNPCKTL